MNIALWLARAGRSHPDHAAVGLGARVLSSYGELAGRAIRHQSTAARPPAEPR